MAPKYPVDRAVTDPQSCLGLQPTGMFFQCGVGVLLQQLEEDLFVLALYRPAPSRWSLDFPQRASHVFFQIQLDCSHAHLERLSHALMVGVPQRRRDNPFS